MGLDLGVLARQRVQLRLRGVVDTPATTRGATYNFAPYEHPEDEREGLSVFAIDQAGTVYHTYSCYARGIDALNTAYKLLDLTPKGRDDQDLPEPTAWLLRHDSYDYD